MVKKKELAPVTGNVEALMPLPNFKGTASSLRDEANQTIPLSFFIQHCADNGYSAGQVFNAIKSGGLKMTNSKLENVHLRSFLSKGNIEKFLHGSGIMFLNVHAEFFWETTKPDYKGGWSIQEDYSKSNIKLEDVMSDIERIRLEGRQPSKPELKRWAEIMKEHGSERKDIAKRLYPKEYTKGYPKLESLAGRVDRLLGKRT